MSRPPIVAAVLLMSLSLASGTVVAVAQDRAHVHGVVTDMEGEPLAGVEVAVVDRWERREKTRESIVKTVATRADGTYEVSVRPGRRNLFLRLSLEGYVGYESELRPRPRGESIRLDFLLPSDSGEQALEPEAIAAYNRGVNALRAGDLRQAGTQFRAAVELDASFAGAHVALAELLIREGSLEEAVPHAEIAVELEPQNRRALRSRALAYGRTDREDQEALEARREYEAIAPRATIERLMGEAETAYSQGRLAEAETRLVELLDRDPEYARAHFLLAFSRINQGDPAGARPHLERFLELAPDSSDAATARELLVEIR